MKNPKSGPVDKPAARELLLFIENSQQLYNQQFIPIVKNLLNKIKKSQFDINKSVKLWQYLADNGAKLYSYEHGDGKLRIPDYFNKATRTEVAIELAHRFVDDYNSGELEHLENPKRIKKHEYTQLFAGLVIGWNNKLMRSSWHGTLKTAIEYAKKHHGIVAIEEILDDGGRIVWERPKQNPMKNYFKKSKYLNYNRDPRVIEAKFDSVCAETGKPIKKGEECVYYPVSKKCYSMDSDTAYKFRMWQADLDMGYDY